MEAVKTIVFIMGVISFIGMCVIVLAPFDFTDKNKRNGF